MKKNLTHKSSLKRENFIISIKRARTVLALFVIVERSEYYDDRPDIIVLNRFEK